MSTSILPSADFPASYRRKLFCLCPFLDASTPLQSSPLYICAVCYNDFHPSLTPPPIFDTRTPYPKKKFTIKTKIYLSIFIFQIKCEPNIKNVNEREKIQHKILYKIKMLNFRHKLHIIKITQGIRDELSLIHI